MIVTLDFARFFFFFEDFKQNTDKTEPDRETKRNGCIEKEVSDDHETNHKNNERLDVL